MEQPLIVADDPEPSNIRKRRWAARILYGVCVPVSMIADAFQCSMTTIYRDLAHPESRDPPTVEFRKKLVLEAGVCFVTRYGALPTAVSWNPRLARAAGGPHRRRSHEGWRSVDDPETHRPWPLAQEANNLWKHQGGLRGFLSEVQEAFDDPGTIYEPVPQSQSPEVRTRDIPSGRTGFLLEAGVCFVTRYGVLPNHVTWNPTLARAAGETERRWSLEGWRSIHSPAIQRPWPLAQEAGDRWRWQGGLHGFLKEVDERFIDPDTTYVPVPLPQRHLSSCALGARFPAPAELPRPNLWAEFALLGPGFDSVRCIWRERPHSDEWLQQKREGRSPE